MNEVYNKIIEINKTLEKIKVQGGKEYVMVKEKVKGLRMLNPYFKLTTEWLLLDLEQGVAVCQATLADPQGNIIGQGTAYEREAASRLNATSFIEVCETSAIGRAIGTLGIGIDDSFGSADEVATALVQQKGNEPATKTELAVLEELCKQKNINSAELLMSVGWKKGDVTRAQHGKALAKLMEGGNA